MFINYLTDMKIKLYHAVSFLSHACSINQNVFYTEYRTLFFIMVHLTDMLQKQEPLRSSLISSLCALYADAPYTIAVKCFHDAFKHNKKQELSRENAFFSHRELCAINIVASVLMLNELKLQSTGRLRYSHSERFGNRSFGNVIMATVHLCEFAFPIIHTVIDIVNRVLHFFCHSVYSNDFSTGVTNA